MTLLRAAPYPRPRRSLPERPAIRRLVAILALGGLSACASQDAALLRSELGALKAEVRAARERDERLQARLEQLEAREAVRAARDGQPWAPGRAPGAEPASAGAAHAAPDGLTVVKLKPRVAPAPPLPTKVEVVEPGEDVVATISVAAAPAATDAPDEDPDVLEKDYEAGVASLRTGNVEGGVQRLLAFASDHPRHPRADNALYFAGLGQVGLEAWEAASRSFQQVLERYPAGDALLDAMLRLAECRVRLKQAADARSLYTRILTDFPGTAAATQAEARLASLKP